MTFHPPPRSFLIEELLNHQKEAGYVSKEFASAIGKKLNIPLAEVYGVIEFYSMIRKEQPGEHIIRICNSPICNCYGAEEIHETLKNKFPDDTVEFVECLGMCEFAPALLIDETPFAEFAPEKLKSEKVEQPNPKVYGTERPLTFRCGKIDPHSLGDYKKYDGMTAFQKTLSQNPSMIIEEMKASGLRGRGGAAFPTGVKWEGAAKAQADTKFIICNADESEPGTFKDRVLMENDPYSIIEGMLIAAKAVGAKYGYIYIRGEYQRAQNIFRSAINTCYEEGYLGKNILGSNLTFDLEVRSGAGAYICGEETALFESIEGKRGFPRIKPPFPTTHGLFNKPTIINNVETFANVPLIFRIGSDQFTKFGTEKSTGPRLFCVSGDIAYPGLYEITSPISLGELITMAGGVPTGREYQSVLLGGAAGKFANENRFEVKLTFEDTQAADLTLGSGVIMVFDNSRDIMKILANLGHFFAHESCGKCYPCQLGTQRQKEILKRYEVGNQVNGDLERLQDIGWTMTDASLCGLGQTAASAVLSAISLWPEKFEGNGQQS